MSILIKIKEKAFDSEGLGNVPNVCFLLNNKQLKLFLKSPN